MCLSPTVSSKKHFQYTLISLTYRIRFIGLKPLTQAVPRKFIVAWASHPMALGFGFCLFGFLTSSSTTSLFRGRAPRQSVWQFYVLPQWDGAGRPWLLSQPVRLYWHRPNQYRAVGHSGNRTRDLFTRSRALYQMSYRTLALGTYHIIFFLYYIDTLI